MTHSNTPGQERGALRSDQNQLILQEGFSFSGYERDPLYLNLGNRAYLDVSGVSGMDSMSDGRAAVFADFDNDGDSDVFLTTLQGDTHLLFRNNVGQSRNFLRLILEGGPAVGRNAYGAVVRVRSSAGTLTKVHAGGSGYVSQNDPRLLFGLGDDGAAQAVEVTWPNGQVELFPATAAAGSTLLLRQGTGRPERVELARAQLPDPLTRSQTFARGLKIAVGSPMPDLPLQSLGHEATSLYRQLAPGRRTVINVWATWCAPCRYEMPELEKLRPQLAARGIDLLALNVDTDPDAKIGRFLETTGVSYPVFLGGVPAIEGLYSADELTVPMSIVVSAERVVEEIIPGWSPETRRSFAALAGVAASSPQASSSTK